MPLMIDAPDCGTAIDAFFLTVGPQIITADPSHNLLLSAHVYRAAYDGLSYIPKCITAKLPIVFGEAANKQDEHLTAPPLLLLLRPGRHPHRPRQNQRLHLPVAPNPLAKDASAG